MKTDRGHFNQDASGLWHYTFDGLGHVGDACCDALSITLPTPAWFWFNGTPSPMLISDTPQQLYLRWEEWRSSYQAHNGGFLQAISFFKDGIAQ